MPSCIAERHWGAERPQSRVCRARESHEEQRRRGHHHLCVYKLSIHTAAPQRMQCRQYVRDAVDEATSSQLMCRACCRILDAHAFSSRQLKNQQTRRCSECIAKDTPLRDRDDLEQVAKFGVRAATKSKDGASLSKRLPATAAAMLREGTLAPNDAAKAVTDSCGQRPSGRHTKEHSTK